MQVGNQQVIGETAPDVTPTASAIAVWLNPRSLRNSLILIVMSYHLLRISCEVFLMSGAIILACLTIFVNSYSIFLLKKISPSAILCCIGGVD